MTNTISSTKCPSTLTSGKYGMSQHLSIIDNSKEYIFVKLTDSALRSIEEYQCALQARRLAHGQRARIQFIGNGGIIHFPTADNNNDGINGGNLSDGRKFGFAIDDVEGSLECVQQSGANLDVLGSLNCRMRIHANDDIYDTTRTKMAIAEETEKSKCIREIKPNQTDIGRKVKRPLSTTSAQVYATNSGVGSSNSCVSISGGNGNGNGSNLSNSKISRNKLSSLNNYSPQSQSINGSNTNSGSALLHSSSTSSRVLKMSSNAHMSPNSTIMGNSDSTIDNISNRCYGGSSNSSVYTGQSHNPSLSAASTLSSTLAGGVTTGYQSALSNGNYQSSMLDLVGYPSNCKVLGGSGNNNNNNNNSGRNSNNSLCRGGKGQGRGNSSLFGGNNKLLDVSRRKLRERLIHLLALKPFKKPELFARLQNEGLSKRDRNNITNLLNDISTLMRDNTYNLKHNLWNNVDENWQYFTEQERQQLKRRKPQNLTPPNSSDAGSTTSGQSPTSHTGSPPPQTSGHGMLKRVRMESGDLYEGPLSSSGGGIQPKKQRISHYKKNALETKIFSSNTANTTTNSPGIRKLGSAGCYSSNNNSNSTYNVFQQSRNSSPYSPQNYNSNSNNTTSSNSNNNASIGNLLHIDDDHLSFKFSSSITENNSGSGASSKKTRNSSGTTSNNTSNKATMKKEKTSFAVQDGLTSRRNNNNKNNNTLSMPYTQNFMLGSQDRHNDDKTSSSNAISNNNSSGNCGSNRALHSQQQQKTPTLSNHITYGHNNNNKHNSNNANCSNADVEVVTSVNRQYNNNCINNNNNNKNNTGSSSRHHHSSTISDSRKHSRSSTPSQNQLTQKRNRNNNNNNNNNNSSVNSTMSNKRYHQNNSTNNTKNNCQFGTSLALPVMPPSHHLLSSNIDVSDCTSDVEQPYKLQTQEYNQHKQLKQHEPESSAQIKRKQSLPTEQEIADVANSFSIDTQGSELMPYDFSNYTTITTVEQRRRYRTDFESEYDEYLELSEKIGKVQTRFRDMGERMASLQPDCRDYHKIKNQIIQEYENLRKEQESINKNNERLNYLGAKLGYIKQLVAEFDKKVKAGEIRITPPPQQIAEEKHRHHQHHNNNTMQNVNQNRNHYQHTHPLTQVMNVPIVTAPAATATFTSTLTTVNDLNLSPMLQTDIKDENDCCSTLSPSSSLVSNSYENARHLKYQDLQSQQRQQQQQNQHQQQQQRYHHYRTHNNHYKQKQHYQQHHVPETIGAIEKNHQSQLQIKENGIDNSNNSVNSNHNKDGVVNGNKCSNYQLNEMYQTQLHHRNHHKQQQHQQQGQQQPHAQQHSPSPLQNYSNSESDSDNDSSSSSSSSDGSDDDDDDGEDEAEAGKVGENHDNVGDDENDDDDDDDDNSHDEGNNSNIDNSNDDCDDDSYHHHNNPTY